MTEKELRRLNRSELIQLLIEQMEENARLEQESAEAKRQLADRTIALADAGSIAEASLRLNHVFDSAEQAAAQYLENVQMAYERCDTLLKAANQKAAVIVRNAELQAQDIVTHAERYANVPSEAELERPRQETPPRSRRRRDKGESQQAIDEAFASMSSQQRSLFDDAFSQMKKNRRR